jgi:hypothetical protein
MSQRKQITAPIGAASTSGTSTTPQAQQSGAALSEAHVVSPPVPLSTPSMRFTKRFNVQITGTMANFEAEGPSTAQWRPVEGQHVKIFTNASADQDLGTAIKVLQSTWLVKATVLEQKNSFPVPLGINVSCIKGQEHIDTGECYTFTSLPMTHNPTPLVIFEADASAQTSQEWRRMYGEYNERNLDTHNVLEVANQNYVFVHENHPVISLLKANADLLGTEITEERRIDGEWYKVSKAVLSTCCSTLKSKVLNKIAFNNLMDFHVSLKRLDAKEWTHESDILSEVSRQKPDVLDQPCSFMARLEMTYELQG